MRLNPVFGMFAMIGAGVQVANLKNKKDQEKHKQENDRLDIRKETKK